MARTSAARVKPVPAPIAVAPLDFDGWRFARTEPAASVVGYTPIDQLYEDYCLWAEAALGQAEPADRASFRAAFAGAPKPLIHFETLQCRTWYRTPTMAECASLTLRKPIQVR